MDGIGVKCLQPDCIKGFPYAKVKGVLPPKSLLRSFDRFLVAAAELASLHTCPTCRVYMEANSTCLYLQCPNCESVSCRVCALPPDRHALPCKDDDRYRRKLEEQLSDVVIPRCASCKRAIVKNGGCGVVVCICGKHQCVSCGQVDVGHCCDDIDLAAYDEIAMENVRRRARGETQLVTPAQQLSKARTSQDAPNHPSERNVFVFTLIFLTAIIFPVLFFIFRGVNKTM